MVSQPALVVSVPLPSGQVHNGVGTDFVLGGKSAVFLFASLTGGIYGWTGDGSATLAATGAAPAAYIGIALGTLSGAHHLYAANPAGNRIDVSDNTFANVNAAFAGKWVDPGLPSGLVPFNIANLGGDLFVSYAPMSPTVVGLGVIDRFDTSGTSLERFATADATALPLYDPWGMAIAPPHFGKFSNALLVGDFNLGNGAAPPPSGGPGYILAFDQTTQDFLGMLKGTDSAPLRIDGLWQLIFGNGGSGGDPSVLYFAAGIIN
ncbi:MAG: TIGR03118 family protein [Candidatus Sulfopaludibacter sp.]|nr:TIGR03118 family protein [Candidatus Sulfopaludibacter sp.]